MLPKSRRKGPIALVIAGLRLENIGTLSEMFRGKRGARLERFVKEREKYNRNGWGTLEALRNDEERDVEAEFIYRERQRYKDSGKKERS